MTFLVSSLAEWSEFLDQLEKTLGGVKDQVMLECGCILSQDYVRKKVKKQFKSSCTQLAQELESDKIVSEGSFQCPNCDASTRLIGPIPPLQELASQITRKRLELEGKLLSGAGSTDQSSAASLSPPVRMHDSISLATSPGTNVDISLLDTPALEPKAGLLSLLRKAADQVASTSSASTSPQSVVHGDSQTGAGPFLSQSLSGMSIDNRQNATGDEEFREFNFYKSFPVYRKQFIHATRPPHTGLLSRNPTSKVNYLSAITPDGSKFLLLGKKKWHVYAISEDYNDPPQTLYSNNVDDDGGCVVAMSDSLIVLGGQTSGIIRAYDMQNNFRLVYHHSTGFGTHCLAVSHQNTVAVGIVGRDKSGQNQPMIVLHYLGMASASYPSSETSAFEDSSCNSPNSARSNLSPLHMLDAKIITVTSPYRDPITTLSFSQDDCYLCCTTYSESRFIVISIMNPLEPRLVMKSARRMDVDQDYEGITSVRFFPHKPRYMAITSVSTAAPPIILDNRLASLTTAVSSSASNSAAAATIAATSQQKVSSTSSSNASREPNRPSVIMKVDKVGTQIHRVEVSPRGDAMAFLDKSGLVYMMSCPGLVSDFKRITVCADVANANAGQRLAASMRFTPNGQALLIVDRKGYLHIEDFGAGLPHQAGMGKCRILA